MTTLGSVATYTCNSGFVLEGEMTRVCQSNGIWRNSPPVCQGKDTHNYHNEYHVITIIMVTDIDECVSDNPCEVRCVNTPGSFECACNQGFQIVNSFNCEGEIT